MHGARSEAARVDQVGRPGGRKGSTVPPGCLQGIKVQSAAARQDLLRQPIPETPIPGQAQVARGIRQQTMGALGSAGSAASAVRCAHERKVIAPDGDNQWNGRQVIRQHTLERDAQGVVTSGLR